MKNKYENYKFANIIFSYNINKIKKEREIDNKIKEELEKEKEPLFEFNLIR